MRVSLSPLSLYSLLLFALWSVEISSVLASITLFHSHLISSFIKNLFISSNQLATEPSNPRATKLWSLCQQRFESSCLH